MAKLQAKYPYYLNNKAVYANEDLEVTDKYTGEVATRCALADSNAIDEGIAGAVRATEPMAKMPSYEKKAVLEHCVTRFGERFDELSMALCIEAGKPSTMPKARSHASSTLSRSPQKSRPVCMANYRRWISPLEQKATRACGKESLSAPALSSRPLIFR